MHSLSNGEDFVTTEQLRRQMKSVMSRRPEVSEIGEIGQTQNLLSDRNSTSSFNENGKRERERTDEADYTTNSTVDESDRRSRGCRILEYGEAASILLLEEQGEKITEAALVSAATSYARGMLPIVSHAVYMLDNSGSEMRLEKIPLLQRPFVHPWESLMRLYSWIVERLAGHRGQRRRGNSPIGKLIFSSNFQTLLLLLVYSLLGTESLVLFVPIAIYYVSFIVMVIATFEMLQNKRELTEFRAWSALFLSYSGGNLNAQEAEYQFCRNNLKPYGHFFLALLANLMIYPVIAHQWTPQSELTIVAFTLTLATLVHFAIARSDSALGDATIRRRYPDFLVLFSFGVHVLAKYPYETDMVVAQTWRFLDIRVPTFASYVVGNGIEFCLNFRAVFYLLIPGVFAKMAARDNWRGTYKTLIPHCVTLSWWQIAILSSQGATWYGLIRGALALVGMVLFFPIASLASIVLPIVAAAKYLSDSELLVRIAITGILGGLPFLASWYLRRRTATSSRQTNLRFNWIITSLQLSFGFVAATFLSWPIINELKDDAAGNVRLGDNGGLEGLVPTLSWEQYQNYCHQLAWEETSSKAQVQVQCAQLEGAVVSWQGYVTNVRLKSIVNNLEAMLNKLPEVMAQPLSCLWGESVQHPNRCHMHNDELRRKSCESIRKTKVSTTKCHLFGWNRYEFEIFVKMKNGMWSNNAEIVLVGDHSFTNFSLNIYPGDKIRFNGVLSNEHLDRESLLGGSRPHVHLEAVGCIACHTNHLSSYKRQRYRFSLGFVTRALYLGTKLVLNFLLNPLVVFK